MEVGVGGFWGDIHAHSCYYVWGVFVDMGVINECVGI